MWTCLFLFVTKQNNTTNNKMEGSLLKRENDFYKLNAALELKAKGLFQEVEYVLKIPDPNEVSNGSSASINCSRSPTRDPRSSDSTALPSTCEASSTNRTALPPTRETSATNTTALPPTRVPRSTNSTALPTTREARSTNSTSPTETYGPMYMDIVPRSLTPVEDLNCEIGPQAAFRLVQVKSQMLVKERDSLQAELKKQTEKTKKKHEQLESLRKDQARWQQQADSAQHKSRKLQHQLEVAAAKLETTEIDNTALKKDVDSLKRQVKQKTQDSASIEVVLNRCIADNEKLNSALKTAANHEKDVRAMSEQENEQSRAMVGCLEKQATELKQGIKRQAQLIENIKQQMTHLEISRFVKFAEEEFSRILDIKMENNDTTAAKLS